MGLFIRISRGEFLYVTSQLFWCSLKAMSSENPKASGKFRSLAMLAGLLVLGALSYWITVSAIPERQEAPADSKVADRTSYPHQDSIPKTRRQQREAATGIDNNGLNAGALPNQRVLVFKDQATLEAFLAKMGDSAKLLGRLDKLNALLLGYDNEGDFLGLLNGTEKADFNYPINIPDHETVGPQDGALAIGNGLLKSLGITVDNSLWGKGVKVAVLDTGIADHLAFANLILRINIVPMPVDPADLNGHGTAVATLIFSNNPFAPGVAPGATPISIRIADDNGVSNSFLIAQGILAAVDAGAQLINISLGGYGKSTLVESALDYAKQRGAIVIAATGNTGREGVLQPAASNGVIAVGAVDAKNQHMNFSTTGSEVSMSAAGHGVNVAYPGDMAANVSGTSFSTPVATGTLAATMSNKGFPTLSGNEARKVVNQNLNDIGAQGHDKQTGAGVPDMWRILNTGKSGIYDAAVTSVSTTSSQQGNQVQVLVQNQGTETLVNTGVSVDINGRTTNVNLTTLASGESRVVNVPVSSINNLDIKSSVRVSGGQTDQRSINNSFSSQPGAATGR